MPLDRVTLVQCDTDRTPDQGTTSGAQSHPANFNRSNLALAAATAREALVRLASERLGAPAERLEVKDGVVRVAADPSRAVSYGSLVGGRKFRRRARPERQAPSPREWTVLGKPVPRLDLPAMATGTVRVRAQRARCPECCTDRSSGLPPWGRRSWASTSAPCGTCRAS